MGIIIIFTIIYEIYIKKTICGVFIYRYIIIFFFSIVKETRTYRSIHKRYLMRCKIDVYLIHKYSLQCINNFSEIFVHVT